MCRKLLRRRRVRRRRRRVICGTNRSHGRPSDNSPIRQFLLKGLPFQQIPCILPRRHSNHLLEYSMKVTRSQPRLRSQILQRGSLPFPSSHSRQRHGLACLLSQAHMRVCRGAQVLRLASLARPVTCLFRLRWGVIEDDVRPTRQAGGTSGSTVDLCGPHAIHEAGRGGIPIDDGAPSLGWGGVVRLVVNGLRHLG